MESKKDGLKTLIWEHGIMDTGVGMKFLIFIYPIEKTKLTKRVYKRHSLTLVFFITF